MAVIIVYWRVGSFDFVDYDDGEYVIGNSHVQPGVTLANIRWAFTTGYASNWHPLTWISHMLDYQLFGLKPAGHHLVNVGFHFLNTLLLFVVLLKLTGQRWRSAFVAVVFALHPLHVESVAWVSERKDVLSTFFLLLTIGAYSSYVRARRSKVLNGTMAGWGYYAAAVVLFALGLMSKPMLVTLPFVLLLLDFWPFGRTGNDEGGIRMGSAKLWARLVLEKLPFFALATLSSVVTYVVQQKGGAVSQSISLNQRLSNALISYIRYLKKTFWPTDLSVLYPHPGNWPVWQVLGAGVVLALIFALVLWSIRARPYIAVGWFWFFGTLVPVIGIVQVGIQSMADRYMYVPLIGLAVAITWGAAELARIGRCSPRALAVACAVALVGCALLTVRQVDFWQNSEKLFVRAVEVTQSNYLAYNNLGYFLANHGRSAEAMNYYRKSIEINDKYEDALNNIGFVLAGQKKHAEAVPYYEAALRVKPRHVEVNNNLGNALSELGRIPEAIKHYQVALEEKPDHADAHNNLGIALAMLGKVDEALPHFRDAIRFKPNYASAHSNLGNALASKGQWDEAITEYTECLRLNPDDPQAHNNLANVLTMKGMHAQAIEHYNIALRLNPNNPEAQFNLGMALIKTGQIAAARQHFAEALRLKPDYAQARQQLQSLPP